MLSQFTTLLLQAAPGSGTLAQVGPVSATLTQSATAAITPVVTITDTRLAAQFPPLPSLYVPVYAVLIVIGLLFAIGVPLLIARRFGTSFRFMLWGAAAGFASEELIIPIVGQQLIATFGLSANPDASSVLGFFLLLALISAAVLILGYYLIYQLILKFDDERSWDAGLMTGAGAGVVIFALTFLFSALGTVASSFQWPPTAEQIASLTADQKAQLPDVIKYYAQLSGFEPIPELWLGLCLAICTIAAAVLVITYFRRREWTWLAGAVGLLFLGSGLGNVADYVLSPALGILGSSIAEIVLYTALAAVAVYLVFRVYEPPSAKPALTPATIVDSAATPTDAQIMTDHPELEAPKSTARRRRRR